MSTCEYPRVPRPSILGPRTWSGAPRFVSARRGSESARPRGSLPEFVCVVLSLCVCLLVWLRGFSGAVRLDSADGPYVCLFVCLFVCVGPLIRCLFVSSFGRRRSVEGAIGSILKIDASYLSPHVNMASRLEGEPPPSFAFSRFLSRWIRPPRRVFVRFVPCHAVTPLCVPRNVSIGAVVPGPA